MSANDLSKKAVVIHSGGMDSSLCLALAIKEYGPENVLSLSFSYQQRHSNELEQAKKICKDWDVDHYFLQIDCLKEITSNSLIDQDIEIQHDRGKPPNTLVLGRNGLMARLGAIHACTLGAQCIYMGVMELECANSGYRDCSRQYMDLMEQILRIDLDDPAFSIKTPLSFLNKEETMELAHKLGILEYLLEETITCYKGISRKGCQNCPACKLRNHGIEAFKKNHPSHILPY
ncbi:MAG: 7-cyano-7-deazaguanine synthase QueC [Chlamydiota bacterium]